MIASVTAPTLHSAGIQRALVTGGNGFIAAALIRRLLKAGVAVRAVCRDPRKAESLAQAGVEVMKGDVQNADHMIALAKGCEAVYHVAAAFTQSATVMYRINVIGSVNMAKAAYLAGAGRFIHVSSIAVYGTAVSGDIFESHPQQPSAHDFYQQSKHIGENAVWEYARKTGLPTTVNRPSFVYGVGSGFWSKTLYDLMMRLPFMPEFPGNAHPIHVDDVVDLMIHQTTHPAAVGEAFNCTPDPCVKWAEFLGYYAAMAGKTQRVKVAAPLFAPLMIPFDLWGQLQGYPQDIAGSLRYLGNRAQYRMDKAHERLGWSPQVSLAAGMVSTEAWLKSAGKDL